MKIHSLFFSLILLSSAHFGFCADPAVLPESTGPVSHKEPQVLHVLPEHFEIAPAQGDEARGHDLVFDMLVENSSTVHKQDIVLPLIVLVKDEFGNTYTSRQYRKMGRTHFQSESQSEISLYPGEKVRFKFRFQAPVAAAREIVIEAYDQQDTFYGRTSYQTEKIQNWHVIVREPERSSEDLIIIYPSDRFVFAPGEKIFLKVGFSEKAGRPRNMYVVLPDYVLTDDQVTGQYELQIPPDLPDGDFQVIVMAEWGAAAREQVVSKTLFFQIKRQL